MTTSTTETSVIKNVDHFTTRDQATTGLVPEKDDLPIVFLDSKLAIVLSASSIAIVLVLAVVVFVLAVAVVLLCMQKTKGLKSAKIELSKMREKSVSPRHTMNTYAPPNHDHCGEEKEDLM